MVIPIAQLSPRRAKNRLARIEEIVETAMGVIEEGGIEALTIQSLARQMSWAVGALYRYYPSKDALLVELQCRVIDQIHELIRTTLSQADQVLRKRSRTEALVVLIKLLLVGKVYRHYALSQPAQFRLIALIVGDPAAHLPDDQGARVLAALLPLLEDVAGLFRQAEKAGVLSSGHPLKRTLLLWTSVHSLIPLAKLGRFEEKIFNIQQLTREATATLFLGWSADAVLLAKAARLADHFLSKEAAGHK
jgi:AcrR family transcriptional regulator